MPAALLSPTYKYGAPPLATWSGCLFLTECLFVDSFGHLAKIIIQSTFRATLPLLLASTCMQYAEAIGIVGGAKQVQLQEMAERGLFPGRLLPHFCFASFSTQC